MATYFFETITAAQALAFSSTDSLVFTNSTSSGAKMTVLYTAPTALVSETITVIDNADGHSVVFGPGAQMLGEAGHGSAIFPDGSVLIIGADTAGGNDTAAGGGLGDGLFGGSGNDSLSGGNGGDLLQGNSGDDTLSGGVGATGTAKDGNDTLFGGQGNDHLDVGDGNNFAQGNLGDDTILATGSATGTDNILLGGKGDDSIVGGRQRYP